MSAAAPPLRPTDVTAAAAELQRAAAAIGQAVLGHPEVVRLLLAAMVARGHILLEDVPGVGKTTLARACAQIMGCGFARLQFTADMLPSDVLGVQILDPQTGRLQFKKGPIFADMVLADEINRASPKTQSAMLEAMAEGRISIDDQTYSLPPTFCVLATQNPVEHHGAYPLPESQLDRFMVRLAVGYPPPEAELQLLLGRPGGDAAIEALPQIFDPTRLQALQALCSRVQLSPAVGQYLLDLVRATRTHRDVLLGCSPRGALALAQIARAWALLDGRDFVLPDDIKALAVPTLGHRLMLQQAEGGTAARQLIGSLLDDLVVPR
jgi:MoxR-like ATPase